MRFINKDDIEACENKNCRYIDVFCVIIKLQRKPKGLPIIDNAEIVCATLNTSSFP